MVEPTLLLRRLRLLMKSLPSTSTRRFSSAVHLPKLQNPSNQTHTNGRDDNSSNRGKKWLTLPPYTTTVNANALGKALSLKPSVPGPSETTALNWVLRCCPDLPRSLVQKLFRLRQVRRKSSVLGDQALAHRLRRVAAKDSMNIGDRVFLPVSVRESHPQKRECSYNEEELNFIRGLVLYKDPAIIVVNKPPGLAVQGGIGVKRSLDEIAAASLRYDYPENPRLVHRLDRDSSGILVMGRTQTSATVLHSIFREKTFAAADDDFDKRTLQRKYWALVIGSPRRLNGLISAPLGKVVVDNGKSDRITVVDNVQDMNSQYAVTKYRVIGSSSKGCTWLELTPLTGRKHQLRVHCAEVLGTPIVGDYKYGWQTLQKWKHLPDLDTNNNLHEKICTEKLLPFGLDLESGSISEKHPRLHLHCKQMVLPNVSKALQGLQMDSDYDFSLLESIDLEAPLPLYMQRSWDILST